MLSDSYWDAFAKSGRIDAYLAYKRREVQDSAVLADEYDRMGGQNRAWD